MAAQMPQATRLFVFVAVTLFFPAATPSFAQQTADHTPGTSGTQQAPTPPDVKQQTTPSSPTQQTTGQQADKQVNVNWLYGSFVPKDVPLVPLTPHQRFQLYLRQTYITWGIYAKTVLFAANGQIKNSPPEWEGASGFGKRALSYQGQFIIQNTISSAGNAYVGWEPRYERCRCEGIKSRTWHAVKRNFVTYNSTDSSLRPQIMPYLGAAGGAAIASVAWLPGSQQPGTKAYQAAITQVFVGVTVNLVAEYAPEWTRLIRRDKKKNAGTPNQH
ncbi:MAG TPA: hypothetical protein VF532_00525 [Candidatus Angelobacter sp.]